MQRQRFSDPDNSRLLIEPPQSGELEQIRDEMADIYEHVDHILDSIGHLDAQAYLDQNRQTGGQ